MNATRTPPRPAPVPRRLFTVADLAALPRSLPSGDVRYELVDGVIVPMAPPGYSHGRRQHTVLGILRTAETLGLGEACGETGVVLRRNPDRVVGADAAFILTASLPARVSDEGYLETIPEVVVEVRSKNDSRPEILDKCDEYHRAGVREVWVIDPDARTLAAHHADGSVRVIREADTVTSELLPGFAVPAAALFAGG
jgi:Uma2 family endonuclease